MWRGTSGWACRSVGERAPGEGTARTKALRQEPPCVLEEQPGGPVAGGGRETSGSRCWKVKEAGQTLRPDLSSV